MEELLELGMFPEQICEIGIWFKWGQCGSKEEQVKLDDASTVSGIRPCCVLGTVRTNATISQIGSSAGSKNSKANPSNTPAIDFEMSCERESRVDEHSGDEIKVIYIFKNTQTGGKLKIPVETPLYAPPRVSQDPDGVYF